MNPPLMIYVMQSAHTDIGYTHPQEQIALMYIDMYDQVFNLCQQTINAPEEQRFKWTCETSWQVRHYVEARPEREEEFLACVRRGQIEITASYLHFTDLIDADAYRRSLEWVIAYCRKHQLPLRCALHCDINGWPWAVADILAELDIPYFCSQMHIDRSPGQTRKCALWLAVGRSREVSSRHADSRAPGILVAGTCWWSRAPLAQ